MATPTSGSLPGTRATTLGVIALLIVFSAGAFAWNIARADNHGQTISACINPAGNLRIIEDGESCRDNETAVSWNQQGPQGEPGQPGEPGEPGQQGPQGEPGTVDVNVNLTDTGPSTSAAPIGYLKLPDINGESTADGHEGDIDIYSWSWGAVRPTSSGSGSGSGGAGAVHLSELTLTKRTDTATTGIVRDLLTGKHIPTATLTIPRPAEEPTADYLVITLENVIITSYQVNQGSASEPFEALAIDFQIVEITYHFPDGSTHTIAWDRTTNAAP